MNQVLVRKPILHNNITGMEKADVLRSDGQTLTVRVGSGRIRTVQRSEVIALAGPSNTEIQKLASPASNPITKF